LIEKSGFVVSASVFLYLFFFLFFLFFWGGGAKISHYCQFNFLEKKKIFKFRFEKNLKKSPFFNKEIGKFMEIFTFLV